jgi:hypothetical protein
MTKTNTEISTSMYGSYVSMCNELMIEPTSLDELTLTEYHKVKETYLAFKRK